MTKVFNISETSKILELINPKSKKPHNHILRYWEKNFKIIKPKKINKRRYYSLKQIDILKKIKYLLKIKGMTILGVKKLLANDINKLDDTNFSSLETDYYKTNLKIKSKKILEKINNIKQYGKKDSS
jgi:DNA-binding transcriptional MerR regulator